MADQSSRDLILDIAKEMKKTPDTMEVWISKLEENFLDTVESLRELGDQDWKDMGFPIGLTKKIKQKISPAEVTTAQSAAPQQPTLILTGGGEETKKEEADPLSVREKAMICLDGLEQNDIRIDDPLEKKAKVKAVISTLFKIISNILNSPFEPKFRKLPKAAGSVKEKILANPGAINFLKIAGFKFNEPGDHILIQSYSKEELESCLMALKQFVERLGGAIHDPLAFNPFKAGVSSTTGQVAVPRDATHTGHTKITSQQSEIDMILQERENTLEGRIEDREIQVYNQKANTQSSNMSQNQFLAMMEKRQEDAKTAQEEMKHDPTENSEMQDETAQAQGQMINTFTGGAVRGQGVQIGSSHEALLYATQEITDEDERRGALAFIADQEKKTKFRDRRAIELDAVKRKAHHTRAKIRVKMPDGYIISATFGAKEKISDVFEFVKNSIVHKNREFSLYETPPKRYLTNKNQSLMQARLVPSCLLYFGWSDLDETKISDGPFLDMVSLRPHIVQL